METNKNGLGHASPISWLENSHQFFKALSVRRHEMARKIPDYH